MERKNTEAALKWIVSLLNKHSIPFQIGGGFAAKVYGSPREVWDIDIALPTNRLVDLLPEVQEYLSHDLKQHHDSNWEFTGMTLEYEGQEIDLVGAQGKKYLDSTTQTWITSENDFTTSEIHEVFGMRLPIMAKNLLIKYKKSLARDVDIIDVQALEQD